MEVGGWHREGGGTNTGCKSCRYSGKYSRVLIDRVNIVKGDKWTTPRGGEQESYKMHRSPSLSALEIRICCNTTVSSHLS